MFCGIYNKFLLDNDVFDRFAFYTSEKGEQFRNELLEATAHYVHENSWLKRPTMKEKTTQGLVKTLAKFLTTFGELVSAEPAPKDSLDKKFNRLTLKPVPNDENDGNTLIVSSQLVRFEDEKSGVSAGSRKGLTPDQWDLGHFSYDGVMYLTKLVVENPVIGKGSSRSTTDPSFS